MNRNGVWDYRETVTAAWRRLGLLASTQALTRPAYVACVQKAAGQLRQDGFFSRQIAQAYVDQAARLREYAATQGLSAAVYTETTDGYPQFQIIPWHAIGDRTGADVVQAGPYKGLRQYNGVIFNQYGRPVAYRILGQTPADDRDVSARDMDFIREPLAVDQGRGLPAFKIGRAHV